MNAQVEKYDSGWVGLSFALSSDEIDVLVSRLMDLKSGALDHFHCPRNGSEALAFRRHLQVLYSFGAWLDFGDGILPAWNLSTSLRHFFKKI